MPYGNINVDTVTTTTPGGILGGGNASLMKNRIINGAMVIDQRNAGASVTPTSGSYTLDRWYFSLAQTSKLTTQQNAGSVTPPVGFTNYLGVTSSSAYSVLTGDYFGFRQSIEGLNVADLGWGTANAKTVTLSFWVRSSLTGTFGGSLFNSAANRSYPYSYTISAANTWEQKSVTIAGDTTGTWLTDNGNGIQVYFSLGAGSTFSGTANTWTGGTWASQPTGSTSVVGTSGATFYITGVQLEVGSSATGFEYRQYTTELSLCQRYFYKISGATQYARMGVGPANSSTTAFITIFMQVPMRTIPSSVTTTGAVGLWSGATVFSVSAVTVPSGDSNPFTSSLSCTSSGLTSEKTYQLMGSNDSTASVALSAEL